MRRRTSPGCLAQVGAGHGGVAAVRLDQRREHPQRGRLARAVRPRKPKISPSATTRSTPRTASDGLLVLAVAGAERLPQPLVSIIGVRLTLPYLDLRWRVALKLSRYNAPSQA